jgi:peroxiredoxin
MFLRFGSTLMVDRQSLNEKLAALADQRREALPAIYGGVLDKVVAHLRDVGMFEGALKVGDPLPPFLLSNAQGALISSDTLLLNGPLVVSFFRGDWCPFCRLTLESLYESHDDIATAGGTLVAITPDLLPATEATMRELNLPFEILSDIDSALGLQCGVIYRMPDDMMEVYRVHDLAWRHGSVSFFLPIPAVFIADQNGIVRYAYVDPDFATRMEPSDIVEILLDLRGKPSAADQPD